MYEKRKKAIGGKNILLKKVAKGNDLFSLSEYRDKEIQSMKFILDVI